MQKSIFTAVAAGAILAMMSVTTAMASKISPSVTEWSAARKQINAKAHRRSHIHSERRAHPARGSYGGVACGYGGCGPVPAGCTPTAGFDFWGNYSGQDDVYCRR